MAATGAVGVDGQQALQAAEELVIHDLVTKKIVVNRKERVLHPLPAKHARQLNSISNTIIQAFNRVGRMSDEEKAKLPGTLLGGQEDAIYNAYRDAILFMATYYGWSDVDQNVVEEKMTGADHQMVLEAQAEVNGKNDFWLAPLRKASQLISQVSGDPEPTTPPRG